MIIPKPVKCEIKDRFFEVKPPMKVFTDRLIPGVLELIKSLDSSARSIDLERRADITISLVPLSGKEEYRILCDESGAAIYATSQPMAVFAIQTLRQIATASGGVVKIPFFDISDSPRFGWRGLSLDVARHFIPMTEVYRVVDLLSFYKFNRLHFHIADDQGFRVEISRFPKLNEIGSFRKSSAVKKGEGEIQDGEPHGGFYTKKEIKSLVAYARSRGIEIVPELDLPGHTCAITASYPELSCEGKQHDVVTEFGLREFSSRILCAGNDGALEFMKSLLLEIAELFPFRYIHIGGDEAGKSEWKKCPKCKARMKALGIRREDELQSFMSNVMCGFLKSMGRHAIVWDDGVTKRTDPDAVSQLWSPLFARKSRSPIKELNCGRKTIVSPFGRLYFDYPYSMTPLKKSYETRLVPRGVKKGNEENILGAECALWTEWVTDREKMWFCLLPRLAAASELMWTADEGRSYADFTSRLQTHYPFYDEWALPYAKGMEKSGGLLKNAKTTKLWFTRDADIELKK